MSFQIFLNLSTTFPTYSLRRMFFECHKHAFKESCLSLRHPRNLKRKNHKRDLKGYIIFFLNDVSSRPETPMSRGIVQDSSCIWRLHCPKNINTCRKPSLEYMERKTAKAYGIRWTRQGQQLNCVFEEAHILSLSSAWGLGGPAPNTCCPYISGGTLVSTSQ